MEQRYLGCLVGLAVGDAVGTTVEFRDRGSFEPVTDMVGGGPFRLPVGAWTDDTSMALCLAESLLAQRGNDPLDQMKRYVAWYRQGVNSSIGRCFDIGFTTRDALNEFERTGNALAGPTREYTAGNGSIMRLAPVVMAYSSDRATAQEQAALSSRTTHGAKLAVDGCRLMADLLHGLLHGGRKDEVLARGYYRGPALEDQVAALTVGGWGEKKEAQIRSTGFAVHSLEAALWALATTTDFASGCLRAVNLGGDADTIAAIYGQFAGAHYGLEGIPRSWRDRVFEYNRLLELGRGLYALRMELERG
ncbi:MAG: ADP-ribosylglycohydrolase family protein [Acidobacteria bacterium]|nr:ADP-ribosylglycohydrolase family protein [Acidobacteriota bacterium]